MHESAAQHSTTPCPAQSMERFKCSGLLDAQLSDVVLMRLLPQLPPARLASLRASCTYLHDLLDSQSAVCIWVAVAAATSCRLHSCVHKCCHQIDPSAAAAQKGIIKQQHCSQCIQQQLAQHSELVRRRRLTSKGKFEMLYDGEVIVVRKWLNTTSGMQVKCCNVCSMLFAALLCDGVLTGHGSHWQLQLHSGKHSCLIQN